MVASAVITLEFDLIFTLCECVGNILSVQNVNFTQLRTFPDHITSSSHDMKLIHIHLIIKNDKPHMRS